MPTLQKSHVLRSLKELKDRKRERHSAGKRWVRPNPIWLQSTV